MHIDHTVDIDSYERLNTAQRHNQFLQSWAWGEFQCSAGNGVVRFALQGKPSEKVFTLIKKSLPLGQHYLYGPRIGIDGLDDEQLTALFDGLRSIAKREGSIFVRFDPCSALPDTLAAHLVRTLDVQPSRTIILDITADETALLAAMHPKTRYNISLARKKGVKVREAGADDFDAFRKLLDETTTRDGFRAHSASYYRKMLALPFIKLLVAEYEGQVIAGNIVSFYGDMATYIHGASGNEQRNVMAPYALQWETIQMAKARGLRYYDLHGIDENKWPGVTRFKRGFGGEEVVYPGTYDLVVSPVRYRGYKYLRMVRRFVGKAGI